MSTALVPEYIAAGRFTTESESNHAGSIWISTLMCITYSSLILLIRGHLRWSVLGTDDYLAVVATILQAGEVGATVVALQHGLGQSQTLLAADQLKTMNASLFTSRLLFIASICVAKLSVILLIMRLFNLNGVRSKADRRTRNMWIICWATAALVVVWGVASIIGLSVDCSISELATKDLSDTCPSQTARWAVISAFDVLTEIILVLLSILIVWPVQLRLSFKVPIVLAFSFRFPCAILAILHSYYVHRYADTTHSTWPFPPSPATNPSSPDPGLALVPAVVLMQIELCWSLISTTIPTLKSFVRSFNSGCGLGLDLDFMSSTTNRYGSSSLSRRGTGHDTTVNSASSPTDAGPGAGAGASIKRLSSLLASSSSAHRKSRTLDQHRHVSALDRELEKLDPISTTARRYSSHHAAVSSPVTANSASTSNRNSAINCWREQTSEDGGSWDYGGGGGGGGAGGAGSGARGGSGGSGGGSGSRDNIIRKDMHYSVHYEPKE